ncbi:LYR motif-containing protein 2 [Desmophyllum pertusum]|uniref:LYR motif-containing protein 2 n=1 Tax=Desmophyllum pertusum TaxID=174260 RepID=A0A9W9YG77_9CNID|nr:LYR motif-containing protein 2 [Desmophyllum pertusum]
MAAGKLPQSALSLKQFFIRKQVLSLYREILRALREVSNKDHRKELADWARSEFKKNKHEKDEVDIQKLLKQNEFLEQTIEELEQELQALLDRTKVKEIDARKLWQSINTSDVIDLGKKEREKRTK